MSFSSKQGVLHAEGVALSEIARRFGTPCYVYSRALLEAAYQSYATALNGRSAMICYAVKANSNLAVLALFARLGAGFDIVSGGELARVLAAGGDPAKVVFSGVGKSRAEMEAALEVGIGCFNVESATELVRLNDIALRLSDIAPQLKKRAPVALRINPEVDAQTHPYISTGLRTSKFGVAHAEALALYRRARQLAGIEMRGIACHIGSQLLDAAPAAAAAEKILALADQLQAEGMPLAHIDLGGGLGIRYGDEAVPSATDFLAPALKLMNGRREKLLVEPGRSLVGNAGLLLTRVEYLKPGAEKNFAVVDAAMNDLARPALYNAWHDIVPVEVRADAPVRYDIVGPVCESGDFLGRERALALAENDLLAILSAGAYGMVMSSNYNTRPRAAEVMVDGATAHLVRRRETLAELFASETMPF